eukprot:CAMPEP_0197390242 /NCGR_PEP_ID=MMETSP1165-20131217/2276_1 /TAXON_ID=284809 /ORGANISM="Chrysocystis fragilis, Strain CCMP3189" /LENGTH=506 /DNA_ID=CAMNT_0042915713 /DNA_START=23 /DNA_END=1543 /DNA_ORIENTATION=-
MQTTPRWLLLFTWLILPESVTGFSAYIEYEETEADVETYVVPHWLFLFECGSPPDGEPFEMTCPVEEPFPSVHMEEVGDLVRVSSTGCPQADLLDPTNIEGPVFFRTCGSNLTFEIPLTPKYANNPISVAFQKDPECVDDPTYLTLAAAGVVRGGPWVLRSMCQLDVDTFQLGGVQGIGLESGYYFEQPIAPAFAIPTYACTEEDLLNDDCAYTLNLEINSLTDCFTHSGPSLSWHSHGLPFERNETIFDQCHLQPPTGTGEHSSAQVLMLDGFYMYGLYSEDGELAGTVTPLDECNGHVHEDGSEPAEYHYHAVTENPYGALPCFRGCLLPSAIETNYHKLTTEPNYKSLSAFLRFVKASEYVCDEDDTSIFEAPPPIDHFYEGPFEPRGDLNGILLELPKCNATLPCSRFTPEELIAYFGMRNPNFDFNFQNISAAYHGLSPYDFSCVDVFQNPAFDPTLEGPECATLGIPEDECYNGFVLGEGICIPDWTNLLGWSAIEPVSS